MTPYQFMSDMYQQLIVTELSLLDFKLKCQTIGLTDDEINQILSQPK